MSVAIHTLGPLFLLNSATLDRAEEIRVGIGSVRMLNGDYNYNDLES